MAALAGPPNETLFTSASIPFTLKPSCHLKKSFQVFKKRKQRNEENGIRSVKKRKIDCDTKEALVECTTLTNDDDKVVVERYSCSNDISVQPEALDVSNCYMTATESFYEGHDSVLKSPEQVVSKKIPAKMWRKRKAHDDDKHEMFFISKKKLKLNSEKVMKKSKRKGNKRITKKG